MSLAERKREFRLMIAETIRSLDPESRREADDAICSVVLGLSEYRACEQLLAYMPLKDEVDVTRISSSAIDEGKDVYLPVTLPGRDLEYRRWRPGEALVRSANGVLEPATGDPLRPARVLILVPGRGFSVDGWRLGRGSGYYDRALRRLSQIGTTVGVAYQCQVVPDLPCGPGDEKLDRIVTELARGPSFR